ncbi:hypothetical protein HY643_00480 [Candidatus Woesearchaeota archaeon]|nr:hypothetical protein [Candidatus Woesearchaeota archaeon]
MDLIQKIKKAKEKINETSLGLIVKTSAGKGAGLGLASTIPIDLAIYQAASRGENLAAAAYAATGIAITYFSYQIIKGLEKQN